MLAKEPTNRPRDAAAVVAELGALGRVESDARAPLSAASKPSITSTEQRLISVVLVASEGGDSIARTVTPEEASFARDDLAAAVAPFGAALEIMADGSVIATVRAR